MLPMMALAQTLEECQQAAERNYPLIRQYGLIEQTTQLTVSNIRKGWLPQVTAQAQATYQSGVAAWPEQMQSMLGTMGLSAKGLKKDQYRVGVDVQQTVYDGGVIRHQVAIARQEGEVQSAQTEVTLYQVRRRVNEMYFGLLLIDEQLKLNEDLQELLAGNEKKLASMFKGGTASESDYHSVKAERLKVVQQATSLQAQRSALLRMLEAFCGIAINDVGLSLKREAFLSEGHERADKWGQRPELKAIDAQLQLADAREKALNAALHPKIGVFAQGYYGYPGFNMFEDMMSHSWSWNGMIGARLTWNLGALYTRKNDKAKLHTQRSMYQVQRETFLFNNQLEQIQQNEDIARYRKLMADDEEIIALRSSIRKAAESKLAHGIIDVNDLLKDINSENAARVEQSVHEIEMLKAMYDLKYTTNN